MREKRQTGLWLDMCDCVFSYTQRSNYLPRKWGIQYKRSKAAKRKLWNMTNNCRVLHTHTQPDQTLKVLLQSDSWRATVQHSSSRDQAHLHLVIFTSVVIEKMCENHSQYILWSAVSVILCYSDSRKRYTELLILYDFGAEEVWKVDFYCHPVVNVAACNDQDVSVKSWTW